MQRLRNDPQEDAQRHGQLRPVTLHEAAQPLRSRRLPLAYRQAGGRMVAQVRRHLCHAPRGARVADAPALAGEGHKVVVPTIVTLRPRKAVGQDATFEVFAKCLEHIGLRRAAVSLSVELRLCDAWRLVPNPPLASVPLLS